MDITFSKLEHADLRQAYDLCMKTFGENTDLSEVERVYQRYGDDPDYYFIVGKTGGKVVAYATVAMVNNLFDGERPIATLWYVCVDEDLRRRGAAAKMIAEIEKTARSRGCSCLFLSAVKGNIPAEEFYRAVGFRDELESAFIKIL